MDNTQNVKRLAKNTILLYVRMFVSMLISLYTSRVILNTLGVEDYGIYNVVGGLIGMFGIVTSTLNTTVSRFLTVELGREDHERLKRVFSTSLTIEIILSVIVVIVAETVGLWYINNVMVIPPDRLSAANWCFQFSIITCVVGLIIVPYNSVIIAHEHMSIYAYMGIFSSLFALFIAFMIGYSPIDKLVFYGFLLLCSTLISFIVYSYYCRKHFNEARFKITLDKEMLRTMFGFAGWNFIGTSAYIMAINSANLFINYFFGPVVNAARGISNSVNTAVSQFASNFTVSMKPQITKSYASGNFDYLFNLIYRGSKLSVLLMMLVSIPILINTNFVLEVWLKQVPEYAVNFTRLTLIYTLIVMLDGPLITTIFATAKVKWYQIAEGILQTLNVLLTWLFLRAGFVPEIVYIISILTIHLTLIAKLVALKILVNLNIADFIIKVYLRCVITAVLAVVIPLLIYNSIEYGWLNFIVSSVVSVLSVLICGMLIGCTKDEREYIIILFKKKFLNRDKVQTP